MRFKEIYHIPEPRLLFGQGQFTEDPRDGLVLYGPYETIGQYDKPPSYTLKAGVVGTKAALAAYMGFVREMRKPIISKKRQKNGAIVSNELQRPSFPGFEAVYNVHWPEKPDIFLEIKDDEITKEIEYTNKKQIRTNKIVDLYLEKIVKSLREDDNDISIWFVLVPRRVYKACRAESGRDIGRKTMAFFKQKSLGQISLFSEEEMFGDAISQYLETSADFHNLLKARANHERVLAPIQIMVEPKLRFKDIDRNREYSNDMKASLAWTLSTGLYYKLGKKPWKLHQVREDVCYLGLVFKRFPSKSSNQHACSAAQLFMSDGDGAVFRGNNGPWLTDDLREFHLNETAAFELIDLALSDFYSKNGRYPKELFIHGRAAFRSDEWAGFQRALSERGAHTKLVCVVIKDGTPLKLFRDVESERGNYGVLRGTSVIISEKEAYLFTRGFVPRLGTSMSMETPNPLHIKVTHGVADIKTVLSDIMSLTKLNYNSCVYGDGKPVTLRFSDNIGTILTATSNTKEEQRQFKYYI